MKLNSLSNYCLLHANQLLEIEVLNKKYHILVKEIEIDWNLIDFESDNDITDIVSNNVIEIKNINLEVKINNKWLKENKNENKKDDDKKDDDKKDDDKKDDDNIKKIEKVNVDYNLVREARIKYFNKKFKKC